MIEMTPMSHLDDPIELKAILQNEVFSTRRRLQKEIKPVNYSGAGGHDLITNVEEVSE
jgi:hypothetical protein